MELSQEKLHEILVLPGHITEEQFNEAVDLSKKNQKSLQSGLIEQGYIKDFQLGELVALALGYPFINLRKELVDETILRIIPELVAKKNGVIAFAKKNDGLCVGMTNPSDIEMQHFIEKKTGEKIVPFFITELDLRDALSRYQSNTSSVFENFFTKLKDETLPREARDELTVEVVDELIRYGFQNKASDIHIEPESTALLVRLRIDGVLHDVLSMPKIFSEPMLTRLKILAGMRTDEHMKAQDGKIQLTIEREVVDIRVSIVPVTGGENVVMRLLSAKSRRFNLSDLGLSNNDLEKVKKSAKNPHGMLLVTGPTGSGKTTSVYALLKILNTREVNIATIEDPVEYDIEGISQIQVNPRTDLTFANGLRAIVRQDPDIIMVGEIRDEETAGIAVNSAMTGHLVLSTLHANDAATTLPRLLDMGIEPFLVASTVNVIIAQRLVRKICEKCRASADLSAEELAVINEDENIKRAFEINKVKAVKSSRVYRGAGCKTCGSTGYIGRIGIFEVLSMSHAIQKLVTARASANDILDIARKEGMTSMMDDGIAKVLQGVTTLEEVIRVARE